MNILGQLEKVLDKWLRTIKLPHLPAAFQKWLSENIWWLVAIGAIVSGITVLVALSGLFGGIAALQVSSSFLVTTAIATWALVDVILVLAFAIVNTIVLGLAVSPLREKKKGGWDLLFIALLLNIVRIVVNLVISLLVLNIFGFIFGLIFGAIVVTASAYFLFEIRSHFVHVSRSRGVKAAKS